ncbi:hypothetical protein MRBBS_2522 [Marinobacter sp. BSs20148]|nr:hypothetical protein MRBBS_2522 [Marinobacter sp. BSs20148]
MRPLKTRLVHPPRAVFPGEPAANWHNPLQRPVFAVIILIQGK